VTVGTLYVVATPIGNLDDITLRAVSTLREVDAIAAEDTRRARALLSHLGISGPRVVRLDANAKPGDIERVADRLDRGENVALTTDAGTPVVSDPGTALVRAALARGARVTPIPGASAVTAALSVSGLCDRGFRFVGFLPRSGAARRDRIADIAADSDPTVVFESARRLGDTLQDLARAMPDRAAMVARELTKIHEELTRGTLAELAAEPPEELRGEITLVLGPTADTPRVATLSEEEVAVRIDSELAAGRRVRDIADGLALELGKPRRELYEKVLTRRSR